MTPSWDRSRSPAPCPLVLGALVTVLSVPCAAAAGVDFEPCPVERDAPGARCGTLRVAEDPSAPEGRTIPIYFEVLAARSAERLPDAILFFTGGPGLAATETVPTELLALARGEGAEAAPWVEIVDRLWQHRDLLYVDVRGTGRSNGLDCMTVPLDGTWSPRSVIETQLFDPRAMRTCLKEFRTRADLAMYTTTRAAADVDAVRAALGYEKVDVVGGSYGSRIGLEYLRRHGEHVRTATLSYVTPPSESLITTMPQDVDEVLAIVFDACAADTACSVAFPDPRGDLQALAAVDWSAMSQTIVDPISGRAESVTFRRDRVVSALRYMLYSTDLQAQLPLFLHEAAAGNYQPLGRVMVTSGMDLDSAFYEGYFAAIKCSEELAFIDYEVAARIADDSWFGRARLDAETALCLEWPKADVPYAFREPVRSSVPTLLMNGDRDVATPSRLARETVRTLERGRYVELRHRSHLLPMTDTCDLELTAAFIESGSVEGLDASCASELELPPFVLRAEDLDPTFLQ